MAEATFTTSGNTTLTLKMTYTANSSGGVTITALSGKSSWSSDSYSTCGIVINGANIGTYAVRFKANNVYNTFWTGSYSTSVPVTVSFSGAGGSLATTSFSWNATKYSITFKTTTGVASMTGGGTYVAGSTITSVATAAPGYTLDRYTEGTSTWTECRGKTSHTDTWSLGNNRTITAYATPNNYTQTINFYRYQLTGHVSSPTAQWVHLGSKSYTAAYATYFNNASHAGDWGGIAGYHYWSRNSDGWTVTGDKNDADGNHHYHPNSYYLQVNKNGGTGGSGDAHVYYGTYIDLTPPTRAGHTFAGWTVTYNNTTGSSLSGNRFTMGYNNSYPYQDYVAAVSVTVTANWSVNSYYIDLNAVLDGQYSGGLGGFAVCDVYINGQLAASQVGDYYAAHPYGTTYEFKNINVATGHSYQGLATGSAPLAGTILDTTGVTMALNTNQYTITYNPNGGSCSKESDTFYYGTTVSLPTATRRNAEFLGWNTKEDGTGEYITNTSSLARNVIVYAIYNMLSNAKIKINGHYVDCMMYVKVDGHYKEALSYVKVDGHYKL